MTQTSENSAVFRVSDLRENRKTTFDLRPGQRSLEQIRDDLGLLGLRKLAFEGALHGIGKSDWELRAKLGATVIQPCVVTLEPVTTRIDVNIERRFMADMQVTETEDDSEEIEMPDDENADPLGAEIDVWQVMIESLALNLPLYPRSAEAQLGEAVFTEPGKKAMRDEDTRPFAGLAGLRDKLAGEDEK